MTWPVRTDRHIDTVVWNGCKRGAGWIFVLGIFVLSFVTAAQGGPTGVVPTVHPTDPLPRRLVIADFADGRRPKAYAALDEECPATDRDAVRLSLEPQDRCGRDGGCLRMQYEFAADARAVAGLRIELPRLDAGGFDHLAFWVKGDSATGFETEIRVGFERPDPSGDGLTQTGSTLAAPVTSEWRLLRVPLSRMTGIRDWSDLRRFFLSVHPRSARHRTGAFYFGEIALSASGTPGPRVGDPVVPVQKRAWEKSLGGRRAARREVRNRLVGWPSRLLGNPPPSSASDAELLRHLARDTWRGLDALTDRQHGLPIDHVRFAAASTEAGDAKIGDYTSTTNIGLYLMSVVAARELGLLDRAQAIARLRLTLATLGRLETYRGFFFNYYDTVSLERTSNFLSFVDSAWLTTGLIVVRQAFPELGDECDRLIERANYRLFYDEAWRLMSHGYYVNVEAPSEYHYGVLYAESRIGSLIAIGKGDAPEEHWFAMHRTFPTACGWQTQRPRGERPKRVSGHRVSGGFYEWQGDRYVPSWGGSMFEALMPTLVLDESAYAPRSLGRNDVTHVQIQRRFAREELGYSVWGLSPSASPEGGYGEYGIPILGSRGYGDGAVTPHASALALSTDRAAAIANLRRLIESYPIYGEYGLYDSVDPLTGKVVHAYLALDQAMILLAITNAVQDHAVQKLFASDPIVRRALPVIAAEDFLDTVEVE